MERELLCTLGPASMSAEVIGRLSELGACLFRINLSHTPLDRVASTIRFIQSCTDVPVCLDTEGAQIRTGDFVDGTIRLRENSIVNAQRRHVPGDSVNINLYPLDIVDALEVGDFVSIDFNSVLVQVVGATDESVALRVLTGGEVGRNKAVTVDRDISLPPLTEKDRAAVGIGLDLGIRHFALSFANGPDDVDMLRQRVGPGATLISKIECLGGLANLDAIAQRSDAVLIDRGDLSRQVPIERIPAVQKRILRRAGELGVKVYVATNLLESMVSDLTPTRAEVNDIHNTLRDGADGLVLAAETAIGAYPVRCASMIVKMIQQFERSDEEAGSYPFDPASLLVAPQGGRLVHREASAADLSGIDDLPALDVAETDLMDCEQFAVGTYSPLAGFMDRETLNAVLETNRLPDGTAWTMPLVLQVDASRVRGLGPGERLALRGAGGRIHALLDVREVFRDDLCRVARLWFGTESADHPGVARLLRGGDTFVGGDVLLVERLPSPHRPYELTPAQTRFVFTHKGWSKVVGFHGRNPPHRVHHHIQLEALRRTGADGLLISPVIGPKKADDFLAEPILRSYQLMLAFGLYPAGRVVLGSFSTYSRYCGPREAVFTALCRRNMGCSHFIVGRDHTGVGTFYGADETRRLFDDLGGLGVEPVYFGRVGYDPETGAYVEEKGADESGIAHISGTAIREALRAGERVPDWVMWEPVQEMLLADRVAGRPLFCE